MKQKKAPAGAMQMNGATSREKPIAAVQRAALVLDAFLKADGALSLAELSAITGLYKSTIGRILRTLEQQDYIVRIRSSDFYVGPAILQLATRFQQTVQPEEVVVPILRDLVDRTGESASYVVPRKEDRIILYRVHSTHAIRDSGLPGDLMPHSRGAAGYIFQAYEGNSARDSHVRERLMATSSGEIEAGMTGMASPVFDHSRECVGAVALTGPSTRFTPEAMSAWTPMLLGAAKALTIRLGGNGRLFDAVLAERQQKQNAPRS